MLYCFIKCYFDDSGGGNFRLLDKIIILFGF